MKSIKAIQCKIPNEQYMLSPNPSREILSSISSEDLIREVLLRDKEHVNSKIQAYWQPTPPQQANEGDIYIEPGVCKTPLIFADGEWRYPLTSTIVLSSFELQKLLTKVQAELNGKEWL